MRNFTKISTVRNTSFIVCRDKSSKNVESICNNFRLEIIKNNFTNRSISELNTDALVWSAVKWVGWLGPRADINR